MRRNLLIGILAACLVLGLIPIYGTEKQEYPQINALFDHYHYTTAEAWGKWFEDNYPGELTASYLTGPLTYQELKEYDIFLTYLSWIPDLGPSPTISEVEALEQYVANGGGVILMGDDTYGSWTNVYCNILSEPYDIIYNDDQLLDPTNYDTTVVPVEDDAERHIVFHNIAEHPVSAGVNSVWVHGACSLVVTNPDAVAVVAGDEDTYSDRYPGYPMGSYPPAIVALEHGAGRIIFSGDNPFLKFDVYDNRIFAWNIFKWLIGSLPESDGPVTLNTSATPNPTGCASTVALLATIDDSTTGNSNIQAAEYFIDTVGAEGTGTPATAQDGGFDSPTENITAQIDVTGLSTGLHTLYIRGQDAAGNWGTTDSCVLTVVHDCAGPVTSITSVKLKPPKCPKSLKLKGTIDDSTTGNSNIQAAEYFIDTVGAEGTGTLATAQDGGFDSPTENITAQIDVTGLSTGLHTLYIRGQDAAGNWGPFQIVAFDIICVRLAQTQDSSTLLNGQMRPLAQHHILKAEELALSAQESLSKAQGQGIDTTGCENLIELAEESMARAQEYFKEGNYIAANIHALEAIRIFQEAIELLKDLLA